MLMEVKKHIILIFKYFKFNLKCSLEYRTSFLIQIIGMMINNSAFIFFWWIIYRQINNISGYTFNDILILWGLSSSSYGVTLIFFGNLKQLSNTIISGGLDSFLIQPKDVIINSTASRTEVSAWGDLIYGYVLLFMSSSLSIYKISMFTLFVILGTIIFFSTYLIINSLCLYLGNIENSKSLFEMSFLTFSVYPEGIYGRVIKILFYTILPIGFMTFMPVKIIRHFNAIDFMIIVGASIFYFVLSYIIFYRGLKRYESGNLIDAKL